MKKPIHLFKIGGNDLSSPSFMEELVKIISEQQKYSACILVHGGGQAISDLMKKIQLEPKFKDGQRITDEASLEVAEMVLSGKINKTIVLELSIAGVDAIGLSGVDRKLIQVEPWGADMNLVGRIINIRAELLIDYCEKDVIPVISPISIGPAGKYNVNADHAAGMIAGAINAERVIFLTDVSGVLINDKVIPELSDQDLVELIENGTINGGMIPKVNAALAALRHGAESSVITNIEGVKNQTGTTIVAQRKNYGK